MKAFWSNLNERERWMVLGCGVICIFYLAYALIYAPIKNGVIDKTAQLSAKQDLLVWMRQTSQQYHSMARVKKLSASQILTVLTTQLSKTSFKQFPYQLQQTGSGDIQLSFDKVPYNAFLNWIWDIHHQYAMSIKQLNIERTDAPGIVKMTMVLSVTTA